MKILLVDDSRAMRQIERKVLAALGEVYFVEAEDGAEALNRIQTARFDLVLVEWDLPGMDGLALVRNIREMDKTTPLMMVATEAEKSKVIDAINAGVNNYVVKPFTPEALLERVRQTLARRRAAA